VAAVLVPERQPVNQIFDGNEAGTFEIGRFAGANALQELKRRRQINAQCSRLNAQRRGFSAFSIREHWSLSIVHGLLHDDGLAGRDFDLLNPGR
jgi:hypothetical protein